MAERTLHLARKTLVDDADAYTATKAEIGACNKMRRRDRHDRAVARRLSVAFGTMNKRRARFLAAQKAVVAAEAAVAGLAH